MLHCGENDPVQVSARMGQGKTKQEEGEMKDKLKCMNCANACRDLISLDRFEEKKIVFRKNLVNLWWFSTMVEKNQSATQKSK